MSMSKIELEEKLAAMAETAEGRERLTQNPKGAVAEILGRDLPAGLNIAIHEDTSETINIVLPPKDELSDDELQGVAGGGGWWCSGNSCVFD